MFREVTEAVVGPAGWVYLSRRVGLLLALLWLCLSPATVQAHAGAVPIERWGPFLPGAQTCLRVISRAAHACFDTVLGIEQRCQDAIARGQSCDLGEVDAQVAEATRLTRVQLGNECSLGELTELGYIGFFDAEADLSTACVTQARGAIAAIYAPARAGRPSDTAARCMAASAAYGRKVMRFILERQTPVMERIAVRLFSPQEKVQSIIRVGQELTGTRERWIVDLLERCPEFETVYGRTPESLLRTLKQRTDCVLSLTYVHDAVVCVAPMCGNGIPEGTEQCDDGNGDDSDSCRNDCTGNP